MVHANWRSIHHRIRLRDPVGCHLWSAGFQYSPVRQGWAELFVEMFALRGLRIDHTQLLHPEVQECTSDGGPGATCPEEHHGVAWRICGEHIAQPGQEPTVIGVVADPSVAVADQIVNGTH